jgi:NAD(P)-dependent dehydrogenase (short-subunit alcohol dehydrogenase family)
MPDPDGFRYDGKRALVVGGATGIGAAAAKAVAALGGEVVVMDRAPVNFPVTEAVKVDLMSRTSIDAAIDQLSGPVHAVFAAAGVADGPGLMKVNFIGHRHVVESLLGRGLLGRGAAICMVSSVAGLGWEGQLPTLLEFLATTDYESAVAWVDAHDGSDNYLFSKQAVNAYVASLAFPFLTQGVRINAICPGPTDTPLAQANADLWLSFGEQYRDATGIGYHRPEQMGSVMAFLNSDAASGVSGVSLLVDSGQVMATMAGAWPADKPLIDLLMGRE